MDDAKQVAYALKRKQHTDAALLLEDKRFQEAIQKLHAAGIDPSDTMKVAEFFRNAS